MMFIYSLFLILLLTLVAVKSDEVSDEQSRVVKLITEVMCDDYNRDSNWYSCIQCCQAMQPAEYKYDPNALARKLLHTGVSDDGQVIAAESNDGLGVDFNEKARLLACSFSTEYAIVLKNLEVDLQGPVKNTYADAAGLAEFNSEKISCFTGCEKDPAPKTDCIPFVPSNSAPSGTKALQYYYAYGHHGSNSATVAALDPPCDKLPITDPANCRDKSPPRYIVFAQLADLINSYLPEHLQVPPKK